jgi:hypothetical protein
MNKSWIWKIIPHQHIPIRVPMYDRKAAILFSLYPLGRCIEGNPKKECLKQQEKIINHFLSLQKTVCRKCQKEMVKLHRTRNGWAYKTI